MADEVITLNVGGVMYTTSRSTLAKYPDSMLGAMFGGQFVPTCFDTQGNYFIDRDGEMFRVVLNFLRSGRLSLSQGFKDFDLLEAEADFFQIPAMISAVHEAKIAQTKTQGYYLEVMDFEETAYFYRFYTDPPRGIHTDLKNGGLVICGSRAALLTLPLPEKTLKDLQTSDSPYRTINVNNNSCSKMAIMHHMQNHNWQLVSSSFANNTDSDGSYMVHKYLWFLPAVCS